MIKLIITVQPKSNKYLEFSQSLEFIKFDLTQLCSSIQIIEENEIFSLVANLNTDEQLIKILESKELEIFSGAIRILAEKSEVIINGNGHKMIRSDLGEIRLVYSKNSKEQIA